LKKNQTQTENFVAKTSYQISNIGHVGSLAGLAAGLP
jgi:hypothetical protein